MEKQYAELVRRAAMFAIAVACFLILVKAFVWWKTGSITMLAAMTDSVLDLFASLVSMFVLKFALQPADENHAFGHGKAESLAAIAQSAFISGSAIFILLQGFHKLTNPELIEDSQLGILVSIVSIIVTVALVIYQKKVVKLTQSPAIQADSLHYQTDLLMNVAILMALVLNLFGLIYADAIFDQIVMMATKHPNIIGVHDILTRRSGAVRFIQMHLELADHLTLLEAHDIADSLEQKILAAFPMSEVIIHQEPTSVVQQERKKA